MASPTKHITTMHLLTLLHRCTDAESNLSASDHRLLSSILTYANHENDYRAWPSTDTLISRTGLSKTTIERSRNNLKKSGWCLIKSGTKGTANEYTINAKKILEAYNASNPDNAIKPSTYNMARVFDAYEESTKTKKPHVRNTSGLKRGQVTIETSPEKYNVPAATERVLDKAPKASAHKKNSLKSPMNKESTEKSDDSKVNPDGSSKHLLGVRCYSFADHKKVTAENLKNSDNPLAPF